MNSKNCEEKAQQALKEKTDATVGIRGVVAKEMCRLLRSGKIDDELDEQSNGVDYLVSRLDIRDGEDDPPLTEKWNYWVGEMEFIDGGFEEYKV